MRDEPRIGTVRCPNPPRHAALDHPRDGEGLHALHGEGYHEWPRKRSGHFGEDAEAGQHQNVDFGMVPRPEQIGIHHLTAVVHDLVKRQGWIGDDVRAGLQANCAPNITANTK